MDYELAKQLKDAGFPISTPHGARGILVPPTLSELIEACGEDFTFLAKADDGSEWLASAVDIRAGLDGVKQTKGSSPEEAVARLYLAIHGQTH